MGGEERVGRDSASCGKLTQQILCVVTKKRVSFAGESRRGVHVQILQDFLQSDAGTADLVLQDIRLY